eukprot:TRINITY_DN14279_c0_g1_i2.p1 TRINITY_DN14279_c0_g1~~TRINITY_DN14279_c0_g1_i2.p1  ORF type:complete len:478 (-),score=80.22 TRINITY_DN14279_c0_g1_i2:14-1447(-)
MEISIDCSLDPECREDIMNDSPYNLQDSEYDCVTERSLDYSPTSVCSGVSSIYDETMIPSGDFFEQTSQQSGKKPYEPYAYLKHALPVNLSGVRQRRDTCPANARSPAAEPRSAPGPRTSVEYSPPQGMRRSSSMDDLSAIKEFQALEQRAEEDRIEIDSLLQGLLQENHFDPATEHQIKVATPKDQGDHRQNITVDDLEDVLEQLDFGGGSAINQLQVKLIQVETQVQTQKSMHADLSAELRELRRALGTSAKEKAGLLERIDELESSEGRLYQLETDFEELMANSSTKRVPVVEDAALQIQLEGLIQTGAFDAMLLERQASLQETAPSPRAANATFFKELHAQGSGEITDVSSAADFFKTLEDHLPRGTSLTDETEPKPAGQAESTLVQSLRQELERLAVRNEALEREHQAAKDERDSMMQRLVSLETALDRTPRSKKGDLSSLEPVSYTHLRAHETVLDLVCRLLLEKKKTENK